LQVYYCYKSVCSQMTFKEVHQQQVLLFLPWI